MKYIHSFELHRRLDAGVFTSFRDAFDKGYAVLDAVPQEGEYNEDHPDVRFHLRKQLMIEVAHQVFVSAQKRGITVEEIHLRIGDQHFRVAEKP